MKEELKGPEVENISVSVVFEENKGERIYNVYLVNERDEALESVLVSSTGYGVDLKTQEKIKTSTLRHSLGIVEAKSVKMIEPIMDAVFGLTNEFWVSFWIGAKMYDKKFIFVGESISEKNCRIVPFIEKPGVVVG